MAQWRHKGQRNREHGASQILVPVRGGSPLRGGSPHNYPNIGTKFIGYRLINPFLLAAGPPSRNAAMIRRAFEAGWAGAVTKTISTRPTRNPSPRLVMFPASRSNRDSAAAPHGKYSSFNIELISTDPAAKWVKWISEIKHHHPDRFLVASIMGSSKPKDWQRLTRQMADAGADALELNISCPHGMPERAMGEVIGQDPQLAAKVTAAVKKISTIPVIVKLTPNVTDIGLISRACTQAGADALSGINTVKSLAGVDIENLRPIPNVAGNSALGGYGGAGVKPIALRCVFEMARYGRIPVSGGGGVFTYEDAIEFMLLGATTIQVCSAVMARGVHIISRLNHGLSDYLTRKGFTNAGQIVGLANPYVVRHSDLKLRRKYVVIDYKKCIMHCHHCLVTCRDAGLQAIELRRNRPAINKPLCDGCGLCVYVCPAKAVKIKDERFIR